MKKNGVEEEEEGNQIGKVGTLTHELGKRESDLCVSRTVIVFNPYIYISKVIYRIASSQVPNPMKLLHLSFTAVPKPKPFLRNGVSPPPNVMIRGFAGASGPAMMITASCKNNKAVILDPDERNLLSQVHSFLNVYQVDKAHNMLKYMIVRGFSPSVATYNELIHGYCRVDRFKEAVGILRDMAKRGLSPDVDTYYPLICGFCQTGKLGKAFEMKAKMVHKGILPDADTYGILILTLCRKGRLSKAFDLFLEMLREGVSPHKYIYTRLMNYYCFKGEFSKALDLPDEMINKGFLPDGISPSLVIYNARIHGCCVLGRVEEALGILRGMADMGLSPDVVSYTNVIKGFCKIGEPGKAFELKLEMDEKGIPLYQDIYESLLDDLSDEVTYSTLINHFHAQGNLMNAYCLESEMSEYSYLTDDVISSVRINGLNKKATTIEAKRALVRWFYQDCLSIPAYRTYDTLIENCSNNEFKTVVGLVKDFSMRGLAHKAAKAHDKMLHGNYKPEGAIYNLLIFDHCSHGNVHKAYDMYKEMVHYGFVSHMFSVLALIKALYYDGRYKEMSCVIQNALRSCSLNDSKLLKVITEIDVQKDDMKALWDVLAEVAMDGLLLDGGKCSHTSAST